MHIVVPGGLVTNSEGQVEEYETIPYALEREVLEETGIIVRVKSLVGIYSNTRKPSFVNVDFICEYISGEPTTSEESTEVEWADRGEALSLAKREAIYK